MPKKRASQRSTGRGGSSGGAGGAVLAFVLGAGVAAGAGYLYLHSGDRVAKPAAERAPGAPVGREADSAAAPVPSAPTPRAAPFGTSEDVFEAGARVYAVRCASCHGTPARDAVTKPAAQQFWRGGRKVVAAEAPGEIYEQIAMGVSAKGMPGYARTLTETQIWQVALLLKSADQELPDPVMGLLKGGR